MSGRGLTVLLVLILLATVLPAGALAADTESHMGHASMTVTPAPREMAPVEETGHPPAMSTPAPSGNVTLASLAEEAHAAHSQGLTAHSDDDLCKIFIIVLGVGRDRTFVESSDLQYGHPPNPGYQNGNFNVIVRAHNGTPLVSYNVWDPRIQIEQNGYHYELSQHEVAENPGLEVGAEGDDIDLPIIIPYHRDIGSVELIDTANGTVLVAADLMPAVDAFRKKFPHDVDMLDLANLHPAGHTAAGTTGLFLPAALAAGVILILLLIRSIRRP
jgi:hypothetical protein